MIYQEHPGVGAVLHVHAWMEDIVADRRQLPVRHRGARRSPSPSCSPQEPDPDNAVIGLRNHGITVTGPSLMAILDRIEPKILRQIPML